MSETLLLTGLGFSLAGVVTWSIAAAVVTDWLEDNDDSHEAQGIASKMFVGRLFGSIPYMGRYKELRGQQGLSAVAVVFFWAGVGSVVVGLGVFWVALGG